MKKGMGIRIRSSITAIFFMGILTASIAFIGCDLYRDSIMDRYITYADTVLTYAYRATVKYSFGDMIAARDMPAEYEVLRSELNAVKDGADIEYLYAIYFEDIEDIHSLHYAINAKTQAELSTGRPLSEIYSYMGRPCEEDAFADDTLMILQQAVKSKSRESGTLEGYSNEYGHMLNGYHVIYDSQDHAVGLICVEIDISKINSSIDNYIRIVMLLAVVLTAVIIFIYLIDMEHFLVRPIRRMAAVSDSFVKKMQNNAAPEELVYNDAGIKASGELQLLADNVKSLADSVAAYMTNIKTVTAERERIGTELNLAHKIQADMLPNTFLSFPDRHEFEIFASMTPAKEVGGDFYDFFLIDDDHLGIVMADVSGKGVPAALFMMMSKILIKNLAMQGHSPAKVLELTNAAICQNNRAEMFVTVWFGVMEISTRKMAAANAGHEYPIIQKANGAFELFKDKHSFVVGGMDDMKYTEYEIPFEEGGTLFLYTDGVTEATNADNVLFGTDRLLEVMNRHTDSDPQTLLTQIKAAVDAFVGEADQFDDLTMLGIHLSAL